MERKMYVLKWYIRNQRLKFAELFLTQAAKNNSGSNKNQGKEVIKIKAKVRVVRNSIIECCLFVKME